MRLLLVEDNERMAQWLGRALRHAGYAVDAVGNGRDAAYLLASEPYDVAIMDLYMPDIEGTELIRRVRLKGCCVPIVVTSARAEVEVRIRCLDLGADDVLAKPFDLAELEARIKSLLRRTQGYGQQRLVCGGLDYDTADRTFHVGESILCVPAKEHAVLELLMQRRGRPVRKEAIYEQIYSLDTCTNPEIIEVYVHRLRRRLAAAGVTIVTLRGLGYCLQPETTSEAPSIVGRSVVHATVLGARDTLGGFPRLTA